MGPQYHMEANCEVYISIKSYMTCNSLHKFLAIKENTCILGPVVQSVDNITHRIKPYPEDVLTIQSTQSTG